MAGLTEFTNALFGAANTVSNVVDDYTTNQAKLSTSNKQIRLQQDINNELMKIQQSSNYENWQTNMNDFFERVKNGMSDQNSQYYCANNLQAQMFESILEQNRVGITEKVNQMVYGAQRDHAIVDYNNNLELYAQQYTGQDYINKANENAKLLYDCGYITEEQLQKQYDTNFERAYIDTNSKIYNDSIADAVKAGMSEEQFINDVKTKSAELMAIDTSGLPKSFDKGAMDETLEKNGRSNYRAYVQDLQNQNETKLSEIYANMLTKNSAEARNAIRKQGQNAIAKMTGLQLDSSVRARYAGYFALEDYLDGGTTTKSQASSAAKKMDPKDFIQFTMNAIERGAASDLGGLDSVYDAWTFFKGEVLEEYQSYEGNENATWAELEKAYPIVGQFFDYAEKNLPPEYQDVVACAENCLKQVLNTKENKELYKEEYESTMDLVKDILFETKKSGTDNVSKEALKTRVLRAINANLGGILEKNKQYKEYFGKDYEGISTLSNYKEGVFGKEKRMAQAMQERDAHPDLVYTDKHGDQKEYALSEGLSRLENDEKSELKKLLGVDDGDITMNYDHDGTHDILARRIYTVNGYDYRFTSDDGKTIKLEKKKNGTTKWEVSKTEKQQKKYDLDSGVKAWKKTDMSQKPPIAVSRPAASGGGEMTQEEWAKMSASFKTNIIKQYIKDNPEEATEWINSLNSK